jgi:hypothetical protein
MYQVFDEMDELEFYDIEADEVAELELNVVEVMLLTDDDVVQIK